MGPATTELGLGEVGVLDDPAYRQLGLARSDSADASNHLPPAMRWASGSEIVPPTSVVVNVRAGAASFTRVSTNQFDHGH